ncbi:MAG: MerR family transcriptional regulator [Aerococcus sp.]|nr:MerR family transcriptional regulator [Aerococcus sp.]
MEMGDQPMNINEVSAKMKISPDTLRYYERIGIIPKIKRQANGYRDYSDSDLNWVHFAKVMRSAGVTIERLLAYIKLVRAGDDTVTERQNLLREQLQLINDQLDKLTEARDLLQYKMDTYATHLARFETEKLVLSQTPTSEEEEDHD